MSQLNVTILFILWIQYKYDSIESYYINIKIILILLNNIINILLILVKNCNVKKYFEHFIYMT